MNNRRKKIPIALIFLNLDALTILNMCKGDPGLLLCLPWGRSKKKKARYLIRPYDYFLTNILKVKNDPQALGRILVDFGLFG